VISLKLFENQRTRGLALESTGQDLSEPKVIRAKGDDACDCENAERE
jgi:hypothetical protein